MYTVYQSEPVGGNPAPNDRLFLPLVTCYLQGFVVHPRWLARSSSINRSRSVDQYQFPKKYVSGILMLYLWMVSAWWNALFHNLSNVKISFLHYKRIVSVKSCAGPQNSAKQICHPQKYSHYVKVNGSFNQQLNPNTHSVPRCQCTDWRCMNKVSTKWVQVV